LERVARPEPGAVAQRRAGAGLAELGRGARQFERARELRDLEPGEHQRDRERPRLLAEERLAQVGIERGQLLVGRLLGQLGVRPEALERTVPGGIRGHGGDAIVLQIAARPDCQAARTILQSRDSAQLEPMPDFRMIPSIDALRQRAAVRALEARFGADATLEALREAASALRGAIAGGSATVADESAAAGQIESAAAVRLDGAFRPSLQRVINATGVVIHTNLGRAPLAPAALERVVAVARGYSSLEYDLGRGGRGRRDLHAEALLCRLTGAEAAVVVNNNAAATMLVLAALAAGREVIVSRGELVEIGGGFRIPDVMAQSGAVLREVGTTNKTRASDYAAAINDRTALLLRVHPSNFRIEGFTSRPGVDELVALGKKYNL